MALLERVAEDTGSGGAIAAISLGGPASCLNCIGASAPSATDPIRPKVNNINANAGRVPAEIDPLHISVPL